jgi:hypothetical protein
VATELSDTHRALGLFTAPHKPKKKVCVGGVGVGPLTLACNQRKTLSAFPPEDFALFCLRQSAFIAWNRVGYLVRELQGFLYLHVPSHHG